MHDVFKNNISRIENIILSDSFTAIHTTGNPRWNNPKPTNPTTGAIPRGLKNLRIFFKEKKRIAVNKEILNWFIIESHSPIVRSVPWKEPPKLAVSQDDLYAWGYNQSSLDSSHCLYKSLQTNHMGRSLSIKLMTARIYASSFIFWKKANLCQFALPKYLTIAWRQQVWRKYLAQ